MDRQILFCILPDIEAMKVIDCLKSLLFYILLHCYVHIGVGYTVSFLGDSSKSMAPPFLFQDIGLNKLNPKF